MLRAGTAPATLVLLAGCCLLLLLPQQAAAQAACSVGDAACFCALIKGTRVATPSTLRPTCRKTIDHGGLKRTVDIYFPADIGAAGVQFQPWVHLHGVTYSQWWLQDHPEWQELSKTWSTPMGGNADASRMNALTGSPITSDSSKSDGSGLVKQAGTILIVPQGTGDVSKGQMWNSVFWTCMALSRCVDSSINDVDFIGTVIKSMPQLLQGISIKPQTALSGYSNGGMLVQALLCQQPSIANSLTGVALIGTMLGTNFASSSCQQKLPRALPLMWIHGQQDPVLPYGPGGRSMGVAALGAEAGTKLWADRMGCPGASSPPATVFSDAGAGVTCVNLCGGQHTTAVLCTAASTGHGLWDAPSSGYTAGMALWTFRGFQGKPSPL